MDKLRVRAYNVRFGDAILVTVPDRAANGTVTKRHILIDVGNVLVGVGGQDEVFEPVIADILEELEGRPLDLYVMTHEHMDHVQGLLWAKEKRGLEISATHSWLTASSEPDYYDRFPDAKKKKLAFDAAYERIALHFRTSASQPKGAVETLMLNNNPRSTEDCVEHLRNVGEKTTYVFRGVGLNGTHPFTEAKFEMLAPEEDTSIYYGVFRPMGLGLAAANGNADKAAAAPGSETPPASTEPIPPSGVDAGAFYNLISQRRRGIVDNLLAIDKAANNTSVVFSLEWRGWRLLFPGDAEERSWKEMSKRSLLGPAHFLKIGHHGSHNGTPDTALLDVIMPLTPTDDRDRSALVSTHVNTYNGVPDDDTLAELAERCTVARIGAVEDELFVDLFFADEN